MSCEAFQEQIMASPLQLEPATQEHADKCTACSEVLKEFLAFEKHLKQAVNIPVPSHLVQSIVTSAISATPRKLLPRFSYALAATMLLFVGAGFVSTLRFEQHNHNMIAHIEYETRAFDTHDAVLAQTINLMMTDFEVTFKDSIIGAEFAKICWVDGKKVMHLVYHNGRNEPITVLFASRTAPHWKTHFNQEGYYGEVISVAKDVNMVIIAKENQNMEGVKLHVLSNLNLALL